MHKNYKNYKSTTSRIVYNRSRKIYLESECEISCARCKYHKNENLTTRYYGGNSRIGIRYPSWKLVSKNRKQWMDKPISITEEEKLLKKWQGGGTITYYEVEMKRFKY